MIFFYFHTPPHYSDRVLWFHVGCLCVHLSIHFSFPDDNLSKHLWIFSKLGICIDIVKIWFGIANGQISSIFYSELSASDTIMAGYYSLTVLFSKQIGFDISCKLSRQFA